MGCSCSYPCCSENKRPLKTQNSSRPASRTGISSVPRPSTPEDIAVDAGSGEEVIDDVGEQECLVSDGCCERAVDEVEGYNRDEDEGSSQSEDSGAQDLCREALDSNIHLVDCTISQSTLHIGPSINFNLSEKSKEDEEACVREFAAVLRGRYRRQKAWFTPLMWTDKVRVHLEDCYLEPLLLVRDRQEKDVSSDVSLLCSELTSTEMTGVRVLLEGDLGYGKSTLVRKLAYDWAENKNKELAETFQLVFLIELRSVTQPLSLVLTEEICGSSRQKSPEETGSFLSNLNGSVLLIIDGYDELPDGNPAKESLKELIAGRFLPQAVVLLTSRSSRTADIHNLFDKVFVVRGFSDASIRKFISKFFQESEDPGLSRKAQTELYGAESAVRHLTNCPLVLYLLCLLFEDMDGQLPHTLTATYTNVFQNTVKRCAAKMQGQKLAEDMSSILPLLGRFCLDVLLADSMVLLEEDMINLCSIIKDQLEKVITEEDLLSLGIMTRCCTISKKKQVYSYQVLHKSFFEYLSALYLQSLEDDPEAFRKGLSAVVRQLPEGVYSPVLTFLVGLMGQKANIPFEELSRFGLVLPTERLWDLLGEAGGSRNNIIAANIYHLPSFFTLDQWEWQRGVLISSLVCDKSCRVEKFHADLQSKYKFHAIEDFPINKNFSIHAVSIDARFSCQPLQSDIVQRILEKPNLTSFSAIFRFKQDSMNTLNHARRSHNLQCLALMYPSGRWGPYLDSDQMETLEGTVNQVVTLSQLYLYPFDYCVANVEILGRLVSSGRLTHLHLPSSRWFRRRGELYEGVPRKPLEALFVAVSSPLSQLRVLDLHKANIEDDDLPELIDAITNGRLEFLDVGNSSSHPALLFPLLAAAGRQNTLSKLNVSLMFPASKDKAINLISLVRAVRNRSRPFEFLDISNWSFYVSVEESTSLNTLGSVLSLLGTTPLPVRNISIRGCSVNISGNHTAEFSHEFPELTCVESDLKAMLEHISQKLCADEGWDEDSTPTPKPAKGTQSIESKHYEEEEVLLQMQTLFDTLEEVEMDLPVIHQLEGMCQESLTSLPHLRTLHISITSYGPQVWYFPNLLKRSNGTVAQELSVLFRTRLPSVPNTDCLAIWESYLLQQITKRMRVRLEGSNPSPTWLLPVLGMFCSTKLEYVALELCEQARLEPADLEDIARAVARNFYGKRFELRMSQLWFLQPLEIPSSFYQILADCGRFQIDRDVSIRRDIVYSVTVVAKDEETGCSKDML